MIEYIVRIDNYGNQTWYHNGQLHRLDGPAIETVIGERFWYYNGLLHREDGPAVEWPDGTKKWCRHGQFHREGGPAIEAVNGNRFWYQNGQLHRLDGPAVEYDDGTRRWFFNDREFTENEFNTLLKKSTVFNRSNQIIEMTVEEICQALGKTVKIVKG